MLRIRPRVYPRTVPRSDADLHGPVYRWYHEPTPNSEVMAVKRDMTPAASKTRAASDGELPFATAHDPLGDPGFTDDRFAAVGFSARFRHPVRMRLRVR